ncbi:MAG: glycosyltransferase family 4 protein, partial [Opitutaceae bacterium]
ISRHAPNLARREKIDGVDHVRLRGTDDGRSFPLNLFSDFRWAIRVTRKLPRADVVICRTAILPIWLRWVKPSAGRVAVVLDRTPKGGGRFYGAADHLLSTSSAITSKLCAKNPQWARRVISFHPPIDWTIYMRAALPGKFSDESANASSALPVLTIGYVGPIHPEKGLRLLLRAAELLLTKKLPPWRIELIGPSAIQEGGGGEMFRDALAADFGRSLGERIAFVDHVFDAEQLALRYGAMAIFCHPSLEDKNESFAVNVAKAMAAGAVPIVSDLPDLRELVQENETGLVFDHRAPGAEERLAMIFARLLRDAALRSALARRAQEQVRRYDYAESAADLLAQLMSPKS